MINPNKGRKRPLCKALTSEIFMQIGHSGMMRKAHLNVKRADAPRAFAYGMREAHTFFMNIKAIRKERKLSQRDLAEMTGYNQSTIQRAEAMKEGVRIEIYLAIADALRVQIGDLFADERTAEEMRLIAAYRAAGEAERRMMQALAIEAQAHVPQLPSPST